MRVHNCPYSYEQLTYKALRPHYDRLTRAIVDPKKASLFVGHWTAGKRLLKDLKLGRKTDFAGCYVFLRGGKARYVGISQHVIKRICEHLNGKTHNTATLAFAMATKATKYKGNRDEAMGFPGFEPMFRKKQVGLSRGRVAFIPVRNPLELYLFEAYAAIKLGTGRWNTFRTH